MQQQQQAVPMMYSYNSALHLQLQQEREKDRHVLHLNNRACVMVLSKGDYSEANQLFDSALMMHKEQTEEDSSLSAVETVDSLPSVPAMSSSISTPTPTSTQLGRDSTSHSNDTEFSDGDLEDYDEFGEMDWDNNGKDDDLVRVHVHSSIDSQLQSEDSQNNINAAKVLRENTTPQNRNKISRMTSFSRLRSLSYCGQQEYHEEQYGDQKPQHHQVYSLPIVMEETEWENAPVQDKSFVLIFNTALCNHLWGMQLMQQYIEATAKGKSNSNSNSNSVPTAAIAEHCRDTLTVSKLLYKLALENSVSFANGVDKMCYVALYNNLSHVCKTLEGYESMEAQWCDDMLLKAIFWWRDSNGQHHNHNQNQNHNHNQSSPQGRNSNNNSNINNSSSADMYLDDDVVIIDSFFDNVYYRIGVPEGIAPATAA